MAKIVTAQAFVTAILDKVRTPAIPYVLGGRSDKGTDCINLIAWVMQELGGKSVERGSNKAWQANLKAGRYTATLEGAQSARMLLPGSILYIDYTKPPGGATGTAGTMDHAGVFVGDGHGIKTPDGRPGNVVHASLSRGGVYPSTLQNAWTHVLWLDGVDYVGSNAAALGGAPVVGGSVPAPAAPAQIGPGPGQAMVVTTTSGLILRHVAGQKTPGKDKTMPIGTVVSVLRVEGDWAQVRWEVKPGLWHEGWACIGQGGVPFLQFG